ncbi:hypothetical protein Bsp3421_000239 (plasmid) [Burkholderia sp. FERM BP-3421]|uniref:hypothetical protein n=1 Tax=Burkholderia sp. FERM BP-3421 TaxID=1494466 RepID=UPI0023614844|nr:hypothetical protein [Burkholderia sp. FERM BP-3421]WDD90401.1 hypothetical protein Bsp3421_000239 [Burkholderia sp. FERM BP-3421]
MTPSRPLPWMLAALVASAVGLGGCERAAPDAARGGPPDVASDASATAQRPIYMDEFNDTLRSMEGPCNDGHIQHGWGLFDTIEAPPRVDAPTLLT